MKGTTHCQKKRKLPVKRYITATETLSRATVAAAFSVRSVRYHYKDCVASRTRADLQLANNSEDGDDVSRDTRNKVSISKQVSTLNNCTDRRFATNILRCIFMLSPYYVLHSLLVTYVRRCNYITVFRISGLKYGIPYLLIFRSFKRLFI